MSTDSRFARHRYFVSDIDDDRFLIDFPIFFTLLVSTVMGAIIAITAFQADMTSRAYIVASQQLLMLIAGISFMFFINMYSTSKGEDRFDVRWMSGSEALESGIFAIIAFSVARITSYIFGITLNKLYNLELSAVSWQILTVTYTSAVFEEIVFGALTIGFYLIVYKFIDMLTGSESLANIIAMITSPSIVGVLFAQIHIGVYGVDPFLMGMLFGGRFIYSAVLLITRNLLTNTLAHVAHNATLAVV